MEGTKDGISERLAAQLAARGLDPAVAEAVGMHTLVGKGGGEALVMPFLREGKVVNRKYRTLDASKRMWQDAGGVQCFWNEDCLRDPELVGGPLLITEGELDALALLQCGYPRVVSVPGGAPEKPLPEDTNKFDFLTDPAVKPLLSVERVPRIILAVDGDGPGSILMHELALRLGKFRCQFLTYPKSKRDRGRERCKDMNEVLEEYGKAGVTATIDRASWMKVDGIYRMSELPPVPDAPIFETGMGPMQKHYKVRLGDVAIWTGIPSHGKSSLVNDLCCNLAARYCMNIAFASFEQMPQRDHRRNLRTWYLRKPVTTATPQEIAAADEWIDRRFTFMVPSEDDEVTLDWTLDRMEAAVIQHGCRVVVIDPWNEMDHARDRSESLTEYTGRAIKALRRFAKKLMVHLIIVAHPSKQQKDDSGNYRIPTLYDISDSAHWYNKADLGVVVHRESLDRTLVRVAKSRYHDEIGVPGDVFASFVFEQRRFEFEDVADYTGYDD